MINYDIKYIKYKNKYLKLKGGTVTKISDASINNKIKEPIDLYYKKYMKYKTKYIESKRLVGGVETCPKIFGFLGVTTKSVGYYLRKYDCEFNVLYDKIKNKMDAFNYDEFMRTNAEKTQKPITVSDLRNKGFPVKFLWRKSFPIKLLKEGGFTLERCVF